MTTLEIDPRHRPLRGIGAIAQYLGGQDPELPGAKSIAASSMRTATESRSCRRPGGSMRPLRLSAARRRGQRDDRKPRWHVIIIYIDDLYDEYDIEKISELHRRIEGGPNFHLIDPDYIRLNQRLPIGAHGAETATPRTEQAATSRATDQHPSTRLSCRTRTNRFSSSTIRPARSYASLGGKTQTRQVRPYDDAPGEPAILDRLPVVRLCQRFARDLEGILLLCSDRRDQMSQHEMLRARTLGHGAEIRGGALAVISVRKHSAALLRSHDGMDRRMHDDISPVGQPLHLIGR